jgi:chromosome segregation ATPase
MEQALSAGSESAAAAAEAESRVRELEEQMAAAELSAEEGRLRVEATQRLTERVAELERELQEATARAESASLLKGDGTDDVVETARQRIAELESEVRQAEQRVDETDMRARRAYAAAEYAEAQLEAARSRTGAGRRFRRGRRSAVGSERLRLSPTGRTPRPSFPARP